MKNSLLIPLWQSRLQVQLWEAGWTDETKVTNHQRLRLISQEPAPWHPKAPDFNGHIARERITTIIKIKTTNAWAVNFSKVCFMAFNRIESPRDKSPSWGMGRCVLLLAVLSTAMSISTSLVDKIHFCYSKGFLDYCCCLMWNCELLKVTRTGF